METKTPASSDTPSYLPTPYLQSARTAVKSGYAWSQQHAERILSSARVRRWLVQAAWMTGNLRVVLHRLVHQLSEASYRLRETSHRLLELGRHQAIRGCLTLAERLQRSSQERTTLLFGASRSGVSTLGESASAAMDLPHAPIPPPVFSTQSFVSKWGHSPSPRVSLTVNSLRPVVYQSSSEIVELSDDEFDELDDEPTAVYNPVPERPRNIASTHYHGR